MKRVASGLVLLLAGCQSYESGVQIICDAPRACAECKDDAALGQYIDGQLTNGDAKKAWTTVRESEPRKREEALRALADLAGIDSCPMAERLAVEPPK